jgi:hypothetical protein
MRSSLLAAVLVASFAFFTTVHALADAPPAGSAAAPSPTAPGDKSASPAPAAASAQTPEEPPKKHKWKHKAWPILDPWTSRVGYDATGSYNWWHPTKGSNAPRENGFAFGFGQSIISTHGAFIIGARAELFARVLDSTSIAVTFPRYTYIGGLHLGPVEPFVGAGLSFFNLDAFHGDWSFNMFSPNAEAGVAFNLGPVRLEGVGSSEFLWRWLGNANYSIQALTFTISIRRSQDDD